MRKSAIGLCLSCLILGWGWLIGAAPAHAGTVYLPLASKLTIGDRTLRTELWISNPTSETLQFTTLFIPSRSDGTKGGDRNTLIPHPVLPGATFFINNAVPDGLSGMLEINSDPALVFSSKLVAEDGDSLGIGARVPIVSSENLLPAGASAELLGLVRTEAGTSSSVGLVNFSQEKATCAARVFTSGGSQMGGAAVLPLQPLSSVQFPEALALLGLENANNVRVEISCDQDFYAYAVILGTEPQETLFVQPSTSGDSKLLAPGLVPPFVQLNAPGTFLAATKAHPAGEFHLPVKPGVEYGSIDIDFDFLFGGYNGDLFHTVFSLRSDGLFCEMAIRGDNSRTFFDTPGESARATGPWRAGRTYHIHASYDVVADSAILVISESGHEVLRQTAKANRSVLGNLDGSLRLEFSLAKIYDNAYFPLWGSKFSNLQVKVFERD